MSKKIIDLQEILYPEAYTTTFIYIYPTFNSELKELIATSGYIKEFKLFERLVDAEGFYSIKIKGTKNIRILFDFQMLNGKKIAILYWCFQEKRTHDYKEAIGIAKARREEIIEHF